MDDVMRIYEESIRVSGGQSGIARVGLEPKNSSSFNVGMIIDR
jgi:hypothetical protein